MAAGGRKASRTCPDETAWSGARAPVQSRTCDRVGRVDLVDVVDEVAVGHRQAGRLAGRGGQLVERRSGDRGERAGQPVARGERDEPRPEPVQRCRPGPARPRPRRPSVASIRAAVDFGRPARSATSVTPSGPSPSAPSTAKARLMDWTLDIGLLVG